MTADTTPPISQKAPVCSGSYLYELDGHDVEPYQPPCDDDHAVMLDADDPHHPAHLAAHSSAFNLCSELYTQPRQAVHKYLHILSESFLLLRLAVQLWSFLGLGEGGHGTGGLRTRLALLRTLVGKMVVVGLACRVAMDAELPEAGAICDAAAAWLHPGKPALTRAGSDA